MDTIAIDMGKKWNEQKYYERMRQAYQEELKRDKWSRDLSKSLKGKGNIFGPLGNVVGLFFGLASLGLYFTTIASLRMIKEEKNKNRLREEAAKSDNELLPYNPSDSDYSDV